jgi:glycosyltransferase involved in cell wall biosynthesis
MDIVVCALGAVVDPWDLPASTLLERDWIHGGERTMYELAAAAAVHGHRVELRGDISRRDYEEIVAATGASISTSLSPRRPTAKEVVLLPEGIDEPLLYTGVALSAARVVMVLLGPPGLFGPVLDPGFVRPDPLTVDPSLVGTPPGYRMIRDWGFELWSNSPAIVAEARASGVDCEFLGTGQPLPYPAPGPKTHDVAFVAANRWAPTARDVSERLDCRVSEVGQGDRASVVRALAGARILLLPARIEGQSRLQLEARAVGTVPVAFSSNRYAAGMDEDGGAVLVESVADMAAAVDELLKDPDRLADLSARAVSSARAQLDWTQFGTRVQGTLERSYPTPAKRLREVAGAVIEGMVRERRKREERLAEELEEVESKLAAANEEGTQLRGLVEKQARAVDELAEELGQLRYQLLTAHEDKRALEAIRQRRSVRFAVWLADRLGPVVRSVRHRGGES